MLKANVCKTLGLDPANVKIDGNTFIYFEQFFDGAISGREEEIRLEIIRRAEGKLRLSELDCGVHWKPYTGPAKPGSEQDSYYFVSFTLGD